MPTTSRDIQGTKGAGRLQVTTGVDLNDDTQATPPIFTGDATSLSVQVVGVTGAHDTHVVTVQGSNDPDGPWVDTVTTVTGEDGDTIAAPAWLYHRAKVSTEQGAASTGSIAIFAKAV